MDVMDKENLSKSSQAANLLVQDLRALAKSENPLLASVAGGILQQAAHIERQLNMVNVKEIER